MRSPGLERHVLAQVPHDVLDVEDHVGGAGVLPWFAVDPAAQPQRPVVDLVGL
jgi:hypothetical protein